jgi:hypothetical protein
MDNNFQIWKYCLSHSAQTKRSFYKFGWVFSYMNKTLALIPVMFAIFALMVSPAVMSVSADKDSSNGKGSDNAHPNECGNSQGKAAQKNPNCGYDTNLDSDRDGMTDAEEIAYGGCLNINDPDSDNDGLLDGSDPDPCDNV